MLLTFSMFGGSKNELIFAATQRVKRTSVPNRTPKIVAVRVGSARSSNVGSAGNHLAKPRLDSPFADWEGLENMIHALFASLRNYGNTERLRQIFCTEHLGR